MKQAFLGIIFAVLCVGCASVEPRRQALAAAYKDETRPMLERVAAFDGLLDTFTSGTSETTLDRFVGWPVNDTRSRIDPLEGDIDHWVWKPGGTFSLHLTAPDGSDRYITTTDGRVP